MFYWEWFPFPGAMGSRSVLHNCFRSATQRYTFDSEPHRSTPQPALRAVFAIKLSYHQHEPNQGVVMCCSHPYSPLSTCDSAIHRGLSFHSPTKPHSTDSQIYEASIRERPHLTSQLPRSSLVGIQLPSIESLLPEVEFEVLLSSVKPILRMAPCLLHPFACPTIPGVASPCTAPRTPSTYGPTTRIASLGRLYGNSDQTSPCSTTSDIFTPTTDPVESAQTVSSAIGLEPLQFLFWDNAHQDGGCLKPVRPQKPSASRKNKKLKALTKGAKPKLTRKTWKAFEIQALEKQCKKVLETQFRKQEKIPADSRIWEEVNEALWRDIPGFRRSTRGLMKLATDRGWRVDPKRHTLDK